jgi:hypothetical protein
VRLEQNLKTVPLHRRMWLSGRTFLALDDATPEGFSLCRRALGSQARQGRVVGHLLSARSPCRASPTSCWSPVDVVSMQSPATLLVHRSRRSKVLQRLFLRAWRAGTGGRFRCSAHGCGPRVASMNGGRFRYSANGCAVLDTGGNSVLSGVVVGRGRERRGRLFSRMRGEQEAPFLLLAVHQRRHARLVGRLLPLFIGVSSLARVASKNGTVARGAKLNRYCVICCIM